MKDDRILLRPMIETCEDIISFSQEETSAGLKEAALVQRITQIGEAARQLTEETRNDAPQIPWKDIIGTGNVLMPDYQRIETDAVWKISTEAIPSLKPLLEELLEKIDEGNNAS